MNTKLLACLFLLFSIHSYSQITFQKGYFIDNNNKKTDCLIKNLDWLNNPTDLEYKLDEQDQSIKINISQLKSFGIDNESKYEKHTVDIDRSSRILSEMGYDKNPIFKSEDLLLKVLIEGKATLLEYNNDNLTRYFFKTDSLPVTQLIHKSYKITEAQIAENNQYKQQLWMGLKCDNIAINEVENLSYKKNRLIKFFIKYNQCNNSEFVDYKVKEKKDRDFFNLTIRPGITSSSLSVSSKLNDNYGPNNNRYADFTNKIGFRIGLEAEFIFPFNKNKWSFIFEPTYSSYKAESTTVNPSGRKRDFTADYNYIEFATGFRHYMFLNNDSKLFINAQYVIEHVSSNSKVVANYYDNITELEITPNNSFALGLGYNYKKKYSIEARTNLKNVLGNYLEWTSKYQSFALVFGYSIF